MKPQDRIYIKNGSELAQEQLDEFGFCFCEDCKRSDRILERHHIVFRSEKPNHPNIHDKKNLILLCRSCHNRYHDKKGTRNELVIARELHLIFGNDILEK